MEKEKEQEVKAEDLDLKLPSSILTQETEVEEDDDSDMPLPETAEYSQPQNDRKLIPTVKFYNLFNECMGKLPYASVLKNSNNEQIKLIDLMRFVEAKSQSEGMTVNEMINGYPKESSRDMEEIEEVINCDADAETKCKMISYILTAKPHYFEKPRERIEE